MGDKVSILVGTLVFPPSPVGRAIRHDSRKLCFIVQVFQVSRVDYACLCCQTFTLGVHRHPLLT